MNRPDYLYRLIQSMTQSEKRYFKMYFTSVQTSGSKKYIRLFDAMRKMEVYDEKKLKHQLQTTISPKQFSNIKKNLYSLLLNTLSNYLATQKTALNIERNLMNYEVLLKKNLLEQAMELLLQTKTICYKTERLNLLPEIILRQIYLTRLTGKYKALYEGLDHEFNLIMQDMRYEYQLSNILYKIEADEEVPTSKIRAYIDDIQEIAPYIHFSINKRLYYQCISTLYEFLGEPRQAFDSSLLWIQELEEHPYHLDENRKKQYVIALTQAIKYCHYLSFYSTGVNLFSKLDQLRIEGKRMNVLVKKAHLLYGFMFLLKEQRFKEAEQNLPYYETTCEEIRNILHISQINQIYINIIFLHMVYNRFTEALPIVNHLINETTSTSREREYMVIRALELFIHLELGDNELLSYRLRTFEQYLNKLIPGNEAYKAILDFFKRTLKYGAEDHFWKDLYHVLAHHPVDNWFDFNIYIQKHFHNVT